MVVVACGVRIELHQLFVGYASLHAEDQQLLLDRVLSVFDG